MKLSLRVHRVAMLAGTTLCLVGTTNAQQASAPPGTNYDELTNTYRAVTNFNIETTRGFRYQQGIGIVALNTHASSLVVFDQLAPALPQFSRRVYPTLNNPVAVDIYGDGSETFAIVLGGSTHAVARHSLNTGRILAVTQLAAAPGDLVVDQTNSRAFASIPGNNTVVQLSLPGLDVVHTYHIPSQAPKFLWLDSATGVVYVTPELSTNNTVAAQIGAPLQSNGAHGGDGGIDRGLVVRLDEASGLPDEDLFALVPWTGPGSSPTPLPVLRGAGTLLMAHGRHPSGDYWIVGTESLNESPDVTRPTLEPELKGLFAENRIVRAAVTGTSLGSVIAATHLDTQITGHGGATILEQDAALSFPAGLAFAWPNGPYPLPRIAAVTGAASDKIRFLGEDGSRLADLVLPEGSIPRHVEITQDNLGLIVHCWGTNQVLVYSLFGIAQIIFNDANYPGKSSAPASIIIPDGSTAATLQGLPFEPLELGSDPSPLAVQRGRELFYDGDNSLLGRTTCNHCHPGGGMDLLGWSIPDYPHDHKDVMVTQSLRSIEDTFPYHWRGERDLEAFNAAFAGILGGSKLDTTRTGNEASEFDDFKSFIFSLQAQANPRQFRDRELRQRGGTTFAALSIEAGQTAFEATAVNRPATLNDLLTYAVGDPVAGQMVMDDPDTLFDRFSCADCHAKVSGTVGDPQIDDLGIPTVRHMDVAHFRELFHKDQPAVEVTNTETLGAVSQTNTFLANRGGFGFSHDGNHFTVFDFLARNNFSTDIVDELDLAAFVEQADHGIAPAAHAAWYLSSQLDQTVRDAAYVEILDLLVVRSGPRFSDNHWVDLTVFGTVDADGDRSTTNDTTDARWFFEYRTLTFRCSDPNLSLLGGAPGVATAAQLIGAINSGNLDCTILGVPPGNGYRFALDRDNDGIDDADEALGEEFESDANGNGIPDGHEVAPASPPSIVRGRIDHAGASYAKVHLEFSEPVQAAIRALPTLGSPVDIVTDDRRVYRSIDSFTVQRLQPTLPPFDLPSSAGASYPMGPILGAIQSTYRVEVTMTGRHGPPVVEILSVTVPFSGGAAQADVVITTANQLALNLWPAGNVETNNVIDPPLLSRIITSAEKLTSTSEMGARFKIESRYERPEIGALFGSSSSPQGMTSSVSDLYVIAQVLVDPAGNGEWRPVPIDDGILGASQIVLDPTFGSDMDTTLVVLTDPADAANPTAAAIAANPDHPSNRLVVDVLPFALATPAPPQSAMLISTPSTMQGEADIEFRLTGLGASDPNLCVKVNVVAILQRHSEFPDIQPVPPAPPAPGVQGGFVFWSASQSYYNMPATLPEHRGVIVNGPCADPVAGD